MKTFLGLLLLVSFHTFSQSQREFVGNHLIIKIRENLYDASKIDLPRKHFGIEVLDKLNAASGISKVSPIGQHKITKTFLLVFENAVDVDAIVKIYQSSGAVDYAEPDFISHGGGVMGTANMLLPNDNYFFRQWGMYNTGTLSGVGNVAIDADVDMELAWDLQTGDPDLIIAIPDSGLRLSHPDIASRLWLNTGEIDGNGEDDDADGYLDDMHGWDWVNDDNLPTDDLGHGTNVIGIIGAVANNNSLYTGANWNSKIMPLKVLDVNNSANNSDLSSSIYYAVDHGAKIISFSIGGSSLSALTSQYAQYAKEHDVLIVACMMNTDNMVSYYPAALSPTFDNIIAVGSTNADDQRTSPFFWSAGSGSNYGNHLNVVAPGNYIFGLDYNSNTNPNSYWGGTSQATPLVAGIASLMLSQNPLLTPAMIRNIIQDTAEDQVGAPSEDVEGFDIYMGHGRVNAFAALQNSLGIPEINSQGQELQIINPEKNGVLQVFSKGNYPGVYKLSIHSIDGKLLRSEFIDIRQGINNLPFDYPSGNYIIALKSDHYGKIFKILKE